MHSLNGKHTCLNRIFKWDCVYQVFMVKIYLFKSVTCYIWCTVYSLKSCSGLLYVNLLYLGICRLLAVCDLNGMWHAQEMSNFETFKRCVCGLWFCVCVGLFARTSLLLLELCVFYLDLIILYYVCSI